MCWKNVKNWKKYSRGGVPKGNDRWSRITGKMVGECTILVILLYVWGRSATGKVLVAFNTLTRQQLDTPKFRSMLSQLLWRYSMMRLGYQPLWPLNQYILISKVKLSYSCSMCNNSSRCEETTGVFMRSADGFVSFCFVLYWSIRQWRWNTIARGWE